MIGEKGRDAFYKGEIADKIDEFMRANGGFLRKADFEKHTSTWVEPVSTNYRGYDVFELPPNGQGIATLQILNILEGFDLRAMGRNSPETLHTMIEAKKIAWADRAKFYADPAFAKIPLAGLLSKSYAAERRKLIDPNHAAKTGRRPAIRRSIKATRFTCAPPMMKATWSRSFKAIIAGWAAASSCPDSDSCFRIAANFSRWTRATRMFTRRANVRFTPSFLDS